MATTSDRGVDLMAVVPPGATALEAFVLMLQERVAALELAHALDLADRKKVMVEAAAGPQPFKMPLLSELTAESLPTVQAACTAWQHAEEDRCREDAVREEASTVVYTLVHLKRSQATVMCAENLEQLKANGFSVISVPVPQDDWRLTWQTSQSLNNIFHISKALGTSGT
jgi:hypothetical protein